MSVGLSIQFLAGRYHATPWDHQVNEGIVEWPPSPWRILRALVAIAYQLPTPPERNLLKALMTQLASEAPYYKVPTTTSAHTRHYMPIQREGKSTTTKVLDTFLAMTRNDDGDNTVKMLWPTVVLSDAEAALLQNLCQRVNYLGRSESWAELRLCTVEAQDCPVQPISEVTRPENLPTTEVLLPLSAEKLAGFQAAIAAFPKTGKGRKKWTAPADVLEALEVDIGQLHSQGWQGIPGTEWMTYVLPKPAKGQPQRRETPVIKADFARFQLVATPLPICHQELVSLTSRFRQALMSRSRNPETGQAAFVFSGRVEDGQPSRENHRHAFYLPELNNRGEVTHITVYCRESFMDSESDSDRAIWALQNLHRVWGYKRGRADKSSDIRTLLVNFGDAEHYQALSMDDVKRGRSPLVSQSRIWRSLTPLFLPRHPKKKTDPETGLQIDGPEYQVRWLLGQNWGLPTSQDDLQVSFFNFARDAAQINAWAFGQRYPAGDYKLRRPGGQGARQSKGTGYWVELQFTEPQPGPIALGYLAHFGLGVFVPAEFGANG